MQRLDEDHHILPDRFIERLMIHEENKLLVYRRGPLVFAFNFHPTNSYSALRIPVPDPRNYKIILNTDDREFAGQSLVQPNTTYPRQDVPMENRRQSVQVYLPSRTAQVLAPV
jgi:1,4-alpha-glucan branching enzyme